MANKEPKRNQFTFAETERTKGLIEAIDKLAEKDKRKRNDYVGLVLLDHVNKIDQE